jgi:hypothetical protein
MAWFLEQNFKKREIKLNKELIGKYILALKDMEKISD